MNTMKEVLFPHMLWTEIKLYYCLADHTERKQTAGVWEQGAEENIWNQKGGSGRKLEKTA
jgi:hypothetical protein